MIAFKEVSGSGGIGFGTWSWGNKLLWGYKEEKDDSELRRSFQEAIKSGFGLVDTADSYGTGFFTGRSESLLGQFLEELNKEERKKIVVATKLAPFPWRIGRKGFKKAFYASKKRLNNHLDRIQLHWSTNRYAPFQEETLLEGMADLVEDGLVKELGLSNVGPLRLKWMHKRLLERGIPLKSLQIQFSLLSPEKEKTQNLISICKDLNIEFLAYSPLALGILTAIPGEEILPKTFLRKEIFKRLLPKSKDLREGILKIATNYDCSMAQVAINWCRSFGTTPIPGIRNSQQAKDISQSFKWKLESKEIDFLNKLSQECSIQMPTNPFQSN